MPFVYILRSERDGNLYIGKSGSIDQRLDDHNNGRVPSTKDRRPLHLLAYFSFTDSTKADHFERYLKTGSGRAFTNKHFL